MLVSDITPAQLAYFDELERVGAALSLCGTAFVVLTFLSSTDFQKPINRLIFYACLGNIFMSVASLIARQALVTGVNTAFCKFQALLIQMFLPADALWTLVMALNVYLTFFRKFDAADLRRLEKWYFLASYGIPFIPAFIYLFVKDQKHGNIYGDATLWCWVSSGWDIWRILTFYGPVWLIILVTMVIYVRCGKEIRLRSMMLREFQHHARLDPDRLDSSAPQVLVTSTIESISAPAFPEKAVQKKRSTEMPAGALESNYDVVITGGRKSRMQENTTSMSYDEKSIESRGSPSSTIPPNTPTSGRRPSFTPASMAATSVMLKYTRVAVLFFIALMMTWIPSSANRVYSVIHPKNVSFFLECFSAFVLPLQGFWNAIIYAVTSLEACQSLWSQIKTHKRITGDGIINILRGFPADIELSHTSNHMLASHPHHPRTYHLRNESQACLKEDRPQTGNNRGGEGVDTSRDNTPRVASLDNIPIDGPAGEYSRDYSRDHSTVV